MEKIEDAKSQAIDELTPELRAQFEQTQIIIGEITRKYELPQIALSKELKALEKVNKAYKRQANAIIKGLSPALTAIGKVVNTYQPHIEAFTKNISPALMAMQDLVEQYRPHIEAFIEGAKRFEEFNISLVERHKRDELMLPPFFASLTMPEIYELFGDKEKATIDIYNDFFHISENIELLITEWSQTCFFEKRLPILRDALFAHQEGKHTLSTPVLLSQIEGILCEILKVRDHAKAKGKLNQFSFKEDELKYPFATPKIITDILVNQIFQSADKYQHDKNYPNRHLITHGQDIYYYEDKYASLRCILLLDSFRSENFMALN